MGLYLPLLTLQLEGCGEKRRSQGAAFAVHSAPAAKAVVQALHGGKGLQSLIHSSLNGIGITPKTALFRCGSERTLHGEAAAEEIGVRPNLIGSR